MQDSSKTFSRFRAPPRPVVYNYGLGTGDTFDYNESQSCSSDSKGEFKAAAVLL